MANILLFGLDSNMRNRLTSAAEQELASLLSVLQDFMLSMEQHAHFLIGGRSSPPNAPMIYYFESRNKTEMQDSSRPLVFLTRLKCLHGSSSATAWIHEATSPASISSMTKNAQGVSTILKTHRTLSWASLLRPLVVTWKPLFVIVATAVHWRPMCGSPAGDGAHVSLSIGNIIFLFCRIPFVIGTDVSLLCNLMDEGMK